MPEYWYSALSGSGAVEEGWMSVPTEGMVAEALRRQGRYLIRAEVRSRARRSRAGEGARRESHAFLEDLADALDAGVPILRFLDDAAHSARSSQFRATLADVRQSVAQDGRRLSEAFAAHPIVFSPLIVSATQAGEANGRLGPTLRLLVDDLDRRREIASLARDAVLYPLALLLAVSISALVLVGAVLPRLMGALAARHLAPPPATRAIASLWSTIPDAPVLAGVLVLAIAAVVGLTRTRGARRAAEALASGLPPFRGLLRVAQAARVTSLLRLFHGSGLGLLDALQRVEETIPNPLVADSMRDARRRIAGGEDLGAALAGSPLLSGAALRAFSRGEFSGSVDVMLDRAAQHCDRDLRATTRRVTGTVNLLAAFASGAIVVIVALAIALPLVQLSSVTGIRP